MSKDEMIALKLVELHKTYVLGDSEVHALSGINLEIKSGEFVVIMGPSGSGKSTLLNVIAGLEPPTRGNVFIFGEDIHSLGDEKASIIRRHELGFVFQFYNLHSTLTAMENVELPMLLAGVKRDQREKRALELLQLVQMDHRAHHYPHEMSGGEQQRIAIARALANDPKILLGDEPTGDLDTVNGRKIKDLLVYLNVVHDKTIVIVTHDPEIFEPFMRILRMEDGRIVEDNKPTESSPSQEEITLDFTDNRKT